MHKLIEMMREMVAWLVGFRDSVDPVVTTKARKVGRPKGSKNKIK